MTVTNLFLYRMQRISSISEKDKERAGYYPDLVKGFYSKPLELEILKTFIEDPLLVNPE